MIKKFMECFVLLAPELCPLPEGRFKAARRKIASCEKEKLKDGKGDNFYLMLIGN